MQLETPGETEIIKLDATFKVAKLIRTACADRAFHAVYTVFSGDNLVLGKSTACSLLVTYLSLM